MQYNQKLKQKNNFQDCKFNFVHQNTYQMTKYENSMKSFIFQQEKTNVVTIIKACLIQHQIISLRTILQKLNVNIQNTNFKIYNFSKDAYEKFDDVLPYTQFKKFQFPWSYVSKDVILIKYLQLSKIQQSQFDEESLQSQMSKKLRSNQRSILEVIEIVKKWRQIHTDLKKYSKKKIHQKPTLYQAAQILGLSKKSLDDYFYQLRLGEKHGFDFQNNFDEGIGVLRKFTAKMKPKGRRNGENQKYQRNLKIFETVCDQDYNKNSKIIHFTKNEQKKHESLNLSTKEDNQGSMNIKQSQGESSELNFSIQKSFLVNPFGESISDKSPTIQQKFYIQFQFEKDFQKDPFIQMNLDPDTKLCNHQQDSMIVQQIKNISQKNTSSNSNMISQNQQDLLDRYLANDNDIFFH